MISKTVQLPKYARVLKCTPKEHYLNFGLIVWIEQFDGMPIAHCHSNVFDQFCINVRWIRIKRAKRNYSHGNVYKLRDKACTYSTRIYQHTDVSFRYDYIFKISMSTHNMWRWLLIDDYNRKVNETVKRKQFDHNQNVATFICVAWNVVAQCDFCSISKQTQFRGWSLHIFLLRLQQFTQSSNYYCSLKGLIILLQLTHLL